MSVQTELACLVDSHVHLDRYTHDTVERMVREAASVGVERLLTIGTDAESSRAALRLAARHPNVLAAVGVHPTRLLAAGGAEEATRRLAALVTDGQPAAIGEVGLDGSAPDLDGQHRFLAACLGLAAEHRLPLVLHVVGDVTVHEAALSLVRQWPAVRTVAHYFVGGASLAARYLEAGCWISVGRPVTRETETALRAAVREIPLGRLLLETDTYPLPGRTTEPKDVTTVCAAVADLTGRTYNEVAAATTANFWHWLAGQQTRA